MIKFLHSADLHLDSPFAALSPAQAAQRRQEQRELPGMLCDLANREQCDFLFLSGDVFDADFVYRETLDALREALAGCRARVFISPGNHDPLTPTSPYLTGSWPENVHIFRHSELEAVALPELGCCVYGAAFTAPTMLAMLQGVRVQEPTLLNFCVLHGDAMYQDSPYNPISLEQITDSGFDYLALGHIHKAGRKASAVWPGCPMGRGFDETGEKGVILGTAKKGQVETRFHPLPVRQYRILEVDAGEKITLPPDSASHIYRIILTGESEGVDLSRLAEQCYALQIRDETLPPFDIWKRCGTDTLEGQTLALLQETLSRCETQEQKRTVCLAAKRIAQVFDGRELPSL